MCVCACETWGPQNGGCPFFVTLKALKGVTEPQSRYQGKEERKLVLELEKTMGGFMSGVPGQVTHIGFKIRGLQDAIQGLPGCFQLWEETDLSCWWIFESEFVGEQLRTDLGKNR